MEETREARDPSPTLLRLLAQNRAITGIFVASILLGAVLGALQLPAEFSLVRRVLGGAVGGAGVALLVTATKMIG